MIPSGTSCTSLALARDHLLVTGIEPVSEFLDDIMKGEAVG
jgi:hypothetical protein